MNVAAGCRLAWRVHCPALPAHDFTDRMMAPVGAVVDADGGAHCWDGSGARVNQGGSYRRISSIAYCAPVETSAKAE